jgi:Clathrin-binding box of Aftiphilin, vesicle trafficking
MSFFHGENLRIVNQYFNNLIKHASVLEPPLDSDIPPPLEDKLNDFDLEDEEIIEENLINNCALPELPTDFNVFSSAATDESISYSHPPPELPDFVIPSSPDVGDSECDKSESETCDVSKEKESDVVLQDDQIPREDKKLEEISIVANEGKENTVIRNVEEVSAASETVEQCSKTFNSAVTNSNVNNSYDDDIPSKENRKIDDSLQNSEIVLDQDGKLPNDDDFNDFVSNLEIESKTEPFVENITVLDTDSKTCDKSPDRIPELKLDDDDDDDDFNDFETAIPMNRQVDQVQEKEAIEEVQFEADFSGFNAFNDESEENNTFDDFQGFKTAAEDGQNKESESQLQNVDDDDDFGDFSDFTQAPAHVTSQLTSSVEPVAFVKPANVNGILDMMFPPTSTCSELKLEMVSSDYSREHQVIKSDNFVNKFNDFDSTLALGYLYSNSKASQTLVKALGIDTRNIVSTNNQQSFNSLSKMPLQLF